MNINQFKKNKDGSYTLCLENGKTYTVYQEVILKYDLLLSKKIDEQVLSSIKKDNDFWKTYYDALDLIKKKARCIKEIKDVLTEKGYLKENVDEAVQKLVDQHYLDDQSYADSYLNHQIQSTSYGPYKIKNILLEKGVSLEIAEKTVEYYPRESELDKVEKRVQKMIRSNHTKSTTFLKQKIKDTLLKDGFSPDVIQEKLENASFLEDNHLKEKEYEKLKKRLMRKYSGEELERQIKKRLYQKGFTYQE